MKRLASALILLALAAAALSAVAAPASGNPDVLNPNGDKYLVTYYKGSQGACGKPLNGRYASSQHWGCGDKVLVTGPKGSTVVTILDRGVAGHGLDVSPRAFRRICGDLSKGKCRALGEER